MFILRERQYLNESQVETLGGKYKSIADNGGHSSVNLKNLKSVNVCNRITKLKLLFLTWWSSQFCYDWLITLFKKKGIETRSYEMKK
jgi:hypothetical protein